MNRTDTSLEQHLFDTHARLMDTAQRLINAGLMDEVTMTNVMNAGRSLRAKADVLVNLDGKDYDG